MAEYRIASLEAGGGHLGIAPIPGRRGTYDADVAAIAAWGADLVLSMNPMAELERAGAAGLGSDLEAAGVGWRHLPVVDQGAPGAETAAAWTAVSAEVHRVLADGGKVMAHCWGGCGRAGMAILRLMVEAGEAPDAALTRLRSVRPCAVEAREQYDWAAEAHG